MPGNRGDFSTLLTLARSSGAARSSNNHLISLGEKLLERAVLKRCNTTSTAHPVITSHPKPTASPWGPLPQNSLDASRNRSPRRFSPWQQPSERKP
jgi:hypothetical protein